jgi:hypothetical protein
MAAEPDPAPPPNDHAHNNHAPREYVGEFAESPDIQGASLESGSPGSPNFERSSFEGVREEPAAQPAVQLFAAAEDEHHRDLDVPAFLRRLRF